MMLLLLQICSCIKPLHHSLFNLSIQHYQTKMHIQAIISLALLSVSMVSATCHGSGVVSTQSDRHELLSNDAEGLKIMCDYFARRDYLYEEASENCFPVPGRRKWNFFFARFSKGSGAKYLGHEDCVRLLRTEVQGCSRGSVNSNNGFKYGYVSSYFHSLSSIVS